MNTDNLREKIARAFYENRVAAIECDEERRTWPAWEDHEKADADEWRKAGASALPIVEAEVQAAKVEALREADRPVTDEMVQRALDAADRHEAVVINKAIIREALTAALTEPPARPEGAEELEAWFAAAWKNGGDWSAAADLFARKGLRAPVALAEVGLDRPAEHREAP